MKVEEKIARCLKERDILKDGQSTRKPLVKSEALQVVRYRPGEFYKEVRKMLFIRSYFAVD